MNAQTNNSTLAHNNASNVDELAQLGRKAVGMWSQGDKGDAVVIFVLFQAITSARPFFVEVRDGKNKIEQRETITVDQLIGPAPMNQDGKTKNTKLIAARTVTIANDLFGLKAPTPAQKQRIIQRALPVALYLANNAEAGDVTLSTRNELRVPYALFFTKPDDKAGANAQLVFERMKDTAHTIDSKKGNSLAELSRRAKPASDRKAGHNSNDKGNTFVEAVKFTRAVVTAVMDKSGENKASDGVTLNSDTRKEMHDLMLSLQGYFAADPVKEEKPAARSNTRAAK